MSEKKHTLADEFRDQDARRATVLRRARECSALSISDVLPQLGLNEDGAIPEVFRNLGSNGAENMVGRLLVSLFPVGVPFYRFLPSPSIRANQNMTPELIGGLESMLYSRELQVQDYLELSNYRLAQRAALESLIVTGNSLTVLDSPEPARGKHNFSMRYFRLNQWVPYRDGSGELLWMITSERKDVRLLDDQTLEKANVKRDVKDPDLTLFTKVELQSDGKWVIRQELNDRIVAEREEKVSPYFPVTYRLIPGEHHARGFVAGRLPELRSHNSLWKSIIEGIAIAVKMTPVVDPTASGPLRARDLMKPNGQPIAGRVRDGIVQGVGFLRSDKQAELSVALQGAGQIEQSAGKGMLIESEAMPTGERVTATAVLRIARELEGALGGPYAHIASQMQIPLVQRLVHVLEAKNHIVALPANLKDVETIELQTGIAALSRSQELDRLMSAIQILGQAGMLEQLNRELVAERILRSMMIDTNGLILTPEQIAAKMQAAQQDQLTSAAGNQAIATIGKIVEDRAGQAA